MIRDIENILSHFKHTPIFIKRTNQSFTIDNILANKLANTLNKIKGKIDTELSNSGNLDITEFIDYKINKRFKQIPSFKIFNETIETNGLDIILLIDCSGSMRSLHDKVRNISATIFKALKRCSFINFKVIAFSAKYHQYQGVYDIIKTLDDCKRIQADNNDLHDIHNLAIDYSVKLLEHSENKKMIIMITDGHPEAEYNNRHVDSQTLRNLMIKSVINAKNHDIPIFCLYYNHIDSTVKPMRKMFRGQLFESGNFNDIEKQLIKQLIKTVEKLNQT